MVRPAWPISSDFQRYSTHLGMLQILRSTPTNCLLTVPSEPSVQRTPVSMPYKTYFGRCCPGLQVGITSHFSLFWKDRNSPQVLCGLCQRGLGSLSTGVTQAHCGSPSVCVPAGLWDSLRKGQAPTITAAGLL